MDRKSTILGALSLAVSAVVLFAAALSPTLRAAVQPTPAPPAGPAATTLTPQQMVADKALYGDRCSACHALPDTASHSWMSHDQWQQTVNRMLYKYQASNSITPDEATRIVDYLSTFSTSNQNQAANANPWATGTNDVWTTSPTASHIFTFSGPAGLAGLAPIASGPHGPSPLWSLGTGVDGQTDSYVDVNIPSPTPDRFAILIDKSDAPRNLDTRSEFLISGGHLSPSIGIVFGYKDPDHYYVLRYSRTQDAIELIKVAGTTHTVLQTTPRVLPVAATPAAAAAPGGPAPAVGPVPAAPALAADTDWHTLRVQINNGLIQGWIDRDKRISIVDPTYAGGKVGLWSQGDTLASFKTWIVDQYDNEPVQRPQS